MNDEQKRRVSVTRAQLGKFEEALSEHKSKPQPPDLPTAIWVAQRESLESTVEDLKEQLADLERAAE